MLAKFLKKNFEKSLPEGKQMAALNQGRFTPATDDTIEELRNGAKDINTSKFSAF